MKPLRKKKDEGFVLVDKKSCILIVGHRDALENSLTGYFARQKYTNVFSSSSLKLDFLKQNAVYNFFKKHKLDYVFLGSIRSGGIQANQKFAAEFIYENLECQNNVIHAAYKTGVKKLLYFSSSCAYFKECPQPMKEEHLLTGTLEPTSEPYAIAKIAGTKLCQSYKRQYGFDAIVAMPATLYGPGADDNMETAHVMGALMAKFRRAVLRGEREVFVWGTGKPRREFLFTDDFVSACVFLMKNYTDAEMINVGCGYDVTIKGLAEMIKAVSGFKGKIIYDASKPDGTMKKLMDNSRLTKLGWKPRVSLEEGIRKTVQWYGSQFGRRLPNCD